MADAKTYSEQEHLAILADRVATETASLTGERENLTKERDELAPKLDVAESAKAAAETRVTELQSEFDTFKADIEEREAAAARKDTRLAKAREAAKHLKDEFFADEARVARIVAMDETAFDSYVADLAATAVSAGATTTAVPRETAMTGSPVVTPTTSAAGRDFLMRRYAATATKEA